jgi:MFS family permease
MSSVQSGGDQQKENGKNSTSDTFDPGYANKALALLSLVAGLVLYIDTMLTPALPKIVLEYGISIDQASLLISLYTVAGVALIPIFGKLGDIYGKKRVMVYILLAYIAAATTTSFAPTFNLVLVSRFVQGVGLGLFALCFSLAREQFPIKLVPRAQGVISAVQVAGGAAGILGGAVITSSFGWQGNYHIAIPIIVVLTVLTYFFIRESPNRKPGVKLDYLGALLLGTSLTAIVLALSEGTSWGWSSLPILGLTTGGLVLIVPLVFYERKIAEPVLDLTLLGQRNIMIANLGVLLFGISAGIALQAIVYALELPSPAGYGISITGVGFYLLPLVVVLLPVALGVGTLIPKFGVKIFLCVGSVLAAAGFLLLSTYQNAEQIEVYLLIFAFGSGMVIVSAQNLLVLSLQKSEMALGISLNTAFRYIGQTLGAPITGTFLSTFVMNYTVDGHVLSLPTRAAFQYNFYTSVIAFTLLAVLAIFSREVIDKKEAKIPENSSKGTAANGRA